MEKLKVAIVGCGRIGALLELLDPYREKPCTHIGSYKFLSDIFDVKAVCDIDKTRVKWVMNKWDVSRGYTSLDEMLDSEKLDVISVCTPPEEHAQNVMKIAIHKNRPKLIFCEKPISTDLHTADSMISFCKKYGVKLLVNHTRRYDDAYRKVKELLDNQEIGDLLVFNGLYSGHSINDGVHMADLALWYSSNNTKINLMNVTSPYLLFEVDLVGSQGRIRILNNGQQTEVYKPYISKRYYKVEELKFEKPLNIKYSFSKAMLNIMKEIAEIVKGKKKEPTCDGTCGFKALKFLLDDR